MRTPLKALMLGIVLLSVVMATMYVRAAAQVVTPRPEELRFYALLNEPIANSNRGAVVAGTSALVGCAPRPSAQSNSAA